MLVLLVMKINMREKGLGLLVNGYLNILFF